MHLYDAVELPPQPWTLAESRRLVCEVLARAAIPVIIQDDLTVAVTEACSKAVRHAADGGLYRLTIDINEYRCRIEIRDSGPGSDPDAPVNGSLDRAGGYGLILMRALVDDVRFEQRRPGVTVTMIKTWGPPAEKAYRHR